jgi:hypothetical protein
MVGGNLTSSEEMMFVFNGTNFTSMVPPIPQAPPQTTFYVRPDGNDANSGFANTPAAAFLTISGAMYAIKQRYISQNQITIRVADGSYTDSFGDTSNYIASWNIVGNTVNPGNVTIIATAVSAGSYPPHAEDIARCCVAFDTASITVSGFTFQSYYENAVATQGGALTVFNCNFTAPSSGLVSPITSVYGAFYFIYGTCQYSGATAIPGIFNASGGGTMVIGFDDHINVDNLVFNIAGTPTLTMATVIAASGGNISFFNTAVSFTGGVPACAQYNCSSGAGISFSTGVTTPIPGTLPGQVTPPGWVH